MFSSCLMFLLFDFFFWVQIWNYWLERMGLELLCCGAVFLGLNGFGAVFLGSDLEMGLEVVMLWL